MSINDGNLNMNTDEGLDLIVPSQTLSSLGKRSSLNYQYDEIVNNSLTSSTGYAFEDIRNYTKGECFSVAMCFSINDFADPFSSSRPTIFRVYDSNDEIVFDFILNRNNLIEETHRFYEEKRGEDYTYTSGSNNTNIKILPSCRNLLIFSVYKKSIKIKSLGFIGIDPTTRGKDFMLINASGSGYETEFSVETVHNTNDVNYLKVLTSAEFLSIGSNLSLLNFYDKDISNDDAIINELKTKLTTSKSVANEFDKLFIAPDKTSSLYTDGTGDRYVELNISSGSTSNRLYYNNTGSNNISHVEGRDICGEPINIMRVKHSPVYSKTQYPTIDVNFGRDKVIEFVVGYYKDSNLNPAWSNIFTVYDSSGNYLMEVMEYRNGFYIRFSNGKTATFKTKIIKDTFRPTIITLTKDYITITNGYNYTNSVRQVEKEHYFNVENTDTFKHESGYNVCNNAAKIVFGCNYMNSASDAETDYAYFACRTFTPSLDLSGTTGNTEPYSLTMDMFRYLLEKNTSIRNLCEDDCNKVSVNSSGTSNDRLAIFAPNKTALTSSTGWKSSVDGLSMIMRSNINVTNELNSKSLYNPVFIPTSTEISNDYGNYIEIKNIRKQNRKLLFVIKFRVKEINTITDNFSLFTLTSKIPYTDGEERNLIDIYVSSAGSTTPYCKSSSSFYIPTGKYNSGIDLDSGFGEKIFRGEFVTFCLEINKDNVKIYPTVDSTSPNVISFSLNNENNANTYKSLLWLVDKLSIGYYRPSQTERPKIEVECIDIYDRDLTADEKQAYLNGNIPNDPNVEKTATSSFPTDQNQITGITNGNLVNTSGVGFTEALQPFPNTVKETAFICKDGDINTATSKFTGKSILYVNHPSISTNYTNYVNAIKNWFKDKKIYSALPTGSYNSQERSDSNAITVQCRIIPFFLPKISFGSDLTYDVGDERVPISIDKEYALLAAEKDLKYSFMGTDKNYKEGDNGAYGYIDKTIYEMLDEALFNSDPIVLGGNALPTSGVEVDGLYCIDKLCGMLDRTYPEGFSLFLRFDFKIKTWEKNSAADSEITGIDSSVAEQNITLMFVNNLNAVSDWGKTLEDMDKFLLNDDGVFKEQELTAEKVNEWFINQAANQQPSVNSQLLTLPEVGFHVEDEKGIIVTNDLQVTLDEILSDPTSAQNIKFYEDEGASYNFSINVNSLRKEPRASFVDNKDFTFSDLPQYDLEMNIGERGPLYIIAGFNDGDYDISYDTSSTTIASFLFSRLYCPISLTSAFANIENATPKGTSIVISIWDPSMNDDKSFYATTSLKEAGNNNFDYSPNIFEHFVLTNKEYSNGPLVDSFYDDLGNKVTADGKYIFNKFNLPGSEHDNSFIELMDCNGYIGDWINSNVRNINGYYARSTRGTIPIPYNTDISIIRDTRTAIVIDHYQHFILNSGENIAITNRVIFFFNNKRGTLENIGRIPKFIPNIYSLTWSGKEPPKPMLPDQPAQGGSQLPDQTVEGKIMLNADVPSNISNPSNGLENWTLPNENNITFGNDSNLTSICWDQIICYSGNSASYESFLEALQNSSGYLQSMFIPKAACGNISNLGITLRVTILDTNNPSKFISRDFVNVRAIPLSSGIGAENRFGDICFKPYSVDSTYCNVNGNLIVFGSRSNPRPGSCIEKMFEYNIFVDRTYGQTTRAISSIPINTEGTISKFVNDGVNSVIDGNAMVIYDFYTVDLADSSKKPYTYRIYHSENYNIDLNTVPQFIPVTRGNDVSAGGGGSEGIVTVDPKPDIPLPDLPTGTIGDASRQLFIYDRTTQKGYGSNSYIVPEDLTLDNVAAILNENNISLCLDHSASSVVTQRSALNITPKVSVSYIISMSIYCILHYKDGTVDKEDLKRLTIDSSKNRPVYNNEIFIVSNDPSFSGCLNREYDSSISKYVVIDENSIDCGKYICDLVVNEVLRPRYNSHTLNVSDLHYIELRFSVSFYNPYEGDYSIYSTYIVPREYAN